MFATRVPLLRSVRAASPCAWGRPCLEGLAQQQRSRRLSLASEEAGESGPQLLLVVAQSCLDREPSAVQQMFLKSQHQVVTFGRTPRQSQQTMPTFTDKSVPVYSPDPGFLIYCIEAASGDVGNSILVSSDLPDLKMSKRAGVPSIAIARSPDEVVVLSAAHPDLVVDSCAAIADAVVKLKDSSTY